MSVRRVRWWRMCAPGESTRPLWFADRFPACWKRWRRTAPFRGVLQPSPDGYPTMDLAVRWWRADGVLRRLDLPHGRQDFQRASPARPREQHGHPSAILAVLIAQRRQQVAFLQPQADENVARGRYREEQVACGHPWAGPERDDEPQQGGMTQKPI